MPPVTQTDADARGMGARFMPLNVVYTLTNHSSFEVYAASTEGSGICRAKVADGDELILSAESMLPSAEDCSLTNVAVRKEGVMLTESAGPLPDDERVGSSGENPPASEPGRRSALPEESVGVLSLETACEKRSVPASMSAV